MRIGFIYRLWKEGGIEATNDEMRKLWSFYEGLSPRNPSDRKFIDGYDYIVGELKGENPFDDGKEWDEQDKAEALAHAKTHIREMMDSLMGGHRPIN